jgi:hypothetical protein
MPVNPLNTPDRRLDHLLAAHHPRPDRPGNTNGVKQTQRVIAKAAHDPHRVPRFSPALLIGSPNHPRHDHNSGSTQPYRAATTPAVQSPREDWNLRPPGSKPGALVR